MRLPDARGPLSSYVVDVVRGHDVPHPDTGAGEHGDEDDFHLALYLCYEFHYTSIEGVDARLEWDPRLISFRTRLENVFEERLRRDVPHGEGDPSSVIDLLLAAIETADSPSLARFLESYADEEQMREFIIHRSAYHLKEADPHSWTIPRLRGPAKAALVEIQSDEYGGGRGDRMHSVLFAQTMTSLGLDASYGAYVDRLPGVTLATVNLMSLFGLNRRLRGASVGHLATFETTSSEPNARYATGLRRLGFEHEAVEFFDEHVEADSVHEVIAIHDLVGGLLLEEPQLAPDILWGARCLLAVDAAWTKHMLGTWNQRRSSLLDPLEIAQS